MLCAVKKAWWLFVGLSLTLQLCVASAPNSPRLYEAWQGPPEILGQIAALRCARSMRGVCRAWQDAATSHVLFVSTLYHADVNGEALAASSLSRALKEAMLVGPRGLSLGKSMTNLWRVTLKLERTFWPLCDILPGFAQLRHLAFVGVGFDSNIQWALASLKHLNSIELQVQDDLILTRAMHNLTNLHALKIILGEDAQDASCSGLRFLTMTSLHDFKLDGLTLAGADLSGFLQNATHLQDLSLRWFALSDANPWIESLSHLQKLRALSLVYAFDDGFEPERSPSLDKVHLPTSLTQLELSHAGWATAPLHLTRSLCQLKSLTVELMDLDPQALLCIPHNVTALTFEGCHLGVDHFLHLGNLTQLKTLVLKPGEEASFSMALVAHGLSFLHSLREIHLFDTQLTADDIGALTSLPRLETLVVSSSKHIQEKDALPQWLQGRRRLVYQDAEADKF
ncbi:MAG: hypothetical protein ACK5O7_01870 [Holosporales bacterium]